MSRFVKIGKAAEILGVSIQTLRRWETIGTISPIRRIAGGTRYYDLDKLLGIKNSSNDLTIAYARVSSHDQKQDLLRGANNRLHFLSCIFWMTPTDKLLDDVRLFLPHL
jgi:predicted site-specific integrase-resolvase